MKAGIKLFQEHVRPALMKHCLECHGGESIKGDFDLSTREALLKSGMIDATAQDSHLMSLITHAEEPHMPFKRPKLPAETIAHIARWIDLGAPYDKPLVQKRDKDLPLEVTDADREFWSFQPLERVEVPAVEHAPWCRTNIDRFILARLEALGLVPNPPAERRTLIRRAYFDLIGLPPKPEEVDAFVADADPEAYAQLIDRLLGSPHYGERWARHWLDVARFAESHGYEQDYDRPHAYHYRDFLIQAFNADMPYDQFVSWQLAGDELAPDDPLALMATGFLGGGAFPTQLTEAEFESARYDELDDMTATTGVAFLGLSVGCARCHDHKYDPIPMRDYYRLAACFTTTIRSEIDLDLQPELNRQRQATFEARVSTLQAALDEYTAQVLPGAFREWLAGYDPESTSLDPWEVLAVKSITSTGGTKYVEQPDGSWLATGEVPDQEVVTIVAETRSTGLRAVRLEALAHDSLPHRGPGRAANGNFALGDIRVAAQPAGAGPREEDPRATAASTELKLVSAAATHQQNDSSLSVAASIDADPISGWALDGGIGRDHAAVFTTAEPFGFEAGTRLTMTLTFQHPNTRHTLGRLRVSVSHQADARPVVGGSSPEAGVRAALAAVKSAPEPNSPEWKTALDWFARQQPKWQQLAGALDAHRKAGPQLLLTKVMVTSEGFPHMPHHADGRGFPHFYPETYFLQRGDVHQKQFVAAPGYLQVLMRDGREEAVWRIEPPSGWQRTSFRRASLARWITDAEHGAGHLAARVIVNRLWQHHFGRGIVSTPNDFGLQGEPPSHPELLDWLARDLIDHGWRLKRLHKLIMTSSVYMQSCAADEQRASIDRENVYHWRRTPRRLEAEAIRDALLAVSGQLDRAMFGPGSLDPNMRRRSVYFFIKRSKLIPMMMLFDWPEHLVSIGSRATTTTAPQALVFMNSPQGRDYAEAFAERLAGAAEPIDLAYRLAYAREVTERERKLADGFLAEQTAAYREAGKPNAERIAWADFCQTLLSANEFVYVE